MISQKPSSITPPSKAVRLGFDVDTKLIKPLMVRDTGFGDFRWFFLAVIMK